MSDKNIRLIADEQNAGVRIDVYLALADIGLSRSGAQKLIGEAKVTIGGVPAAKKYLVKPGDEVNVCIPPPVETEVKPQAIPIEIAFEDSDLLVVNKPKGMVVHPAAGNYDGTLVNALLAYCGDDLSGINGVIRPGIVHRIDKDTSGLLIVAKNDFAHRGLAEQIKVHSFMRIYEAVVCGNIKQDSGTVDAPIGRHPVQRKKMAVTAEHSRNAVTHYEVVRRYRDYTHLRLRLETGRTHQIRVHMAYLGHPVAGDEVYGKKGKGAAAKLQGQCLHAKYISFIHPRDGRKVSVDSELPPYFTEFLSKLQPL